MNLYSFDIMTNCLRDSALQVNLSKQKNNIYLYIS